MKHIVQEKRCTLVTKAYTLLQSNFNVLQMVVSWEWKYLSTYNMQIHIDFLSGNLIKSQSASNKRRCSAVNAILIDSIMSSVQTSTQKIWFYPTSESGLVDNFIFDSVVFPEGVALVEMVDGKFK